MLKPNIKLINFELHTSDKFRHRAIIAFKDVHKGYNIITKPAKL
jgi:hypothetical protein